MFDPQSKKTLSILLFVALHTPLCNAWQANAFRVSFWWRTACVAYPAATWHGKTYRCGAIWRNEKNVKNEKKRKKHEKMEKCLPCFCFFTAVLNCDRATHGLPAVQAPVVPWVSLPGPTGVPTDTQAGWHRGQSANPYLLHCCTAAALLSLY